MSQTMRYSALVALTAALLICFKYGQQADWMAVGVLSALKLLLVVLLVGMVFLEVLRSPVKIDRNVRDGSKADLSR